MFVVLRHENQYYQCGGYFVGVFREWEDCESPNGHFGRLDNEETWYTFKEFDVGRLYDEGSHIHVGE